MNYTGYLRRRVGTVFAWVALLTGIILPVKAADTDAEVNRLIQAGKFQAAQALVKKAAAEGATEAERRKYGGMGSEFERYGKWRRNWSPNDPEPQTITVAPYYFDEPVVTQPAKRPTNNPPAQTVTVVPYNLDELMGTQPTERPEVTKKEPPKVPIETPPPKPVEPAKKPWAPVTAIGGYVNDWVVVNSVNSPYSAQLTRLAKEFPKEWIQDGWNQGYRISHVAGDGGQWFVGMSKRKDGALRGQYYMGPGKIDQTSIAEKWERGYRIIAVAGWHDQWVVVMSSGTGWGRQRFTSVGPFKDDWVNARYKEGYVVTSIAGDIVPQEGNRAEYGSYFTVVTQGTGWQQTWRFGDATQMKSFRHEFKDAGWSLTAWVPWKKDRGIIFFSKGLPDNEGKGFGCHFRANSSDMAARLNKMLAGEY